MKRSRLFHKVPALEKLYQLIIGGGLLLILTPFRLFFPRKKNQIILIGTSNGLFIDNIKYLFLHLEEKESELNYFFLTSNREVYKTLKQHFDRILYYPSIRGIWILFRSNIVVTDNTVLDQKFRFAFVKGAKHVQLWHGAGIKKFWNCSPSLGTRLLKPYFHLTEKKRNFDSFISTSEFFTQNYFQKAFLSHLFPVTGYPRNDLFWQEKPLTESVLLETDQNCLTKAQEFKKQGTKVLIYVPTFRGIRGRGNNTLSLDLERLNQFAKERNLLIILKLHPILKNQEKAIVFDRILFHRSDKDVYPILTLCDAMITDYSSIFMDFMILDRPVLFYMYDKQEYENKDRELTTFYEDFIIGRTSFNQSALEEDIIEVVCGSKPSEFKAKRDNALQLTFEHQDDGASARILQHIKEVYL